MTFCQRKLSGSKGEAKNKTASKKQLCGKAMVSVTYVPTWKTMSTAAHVRARIGRNATQSANHST